jgi:hypothetical protein
MSEKISDHPHFKFSYRAYCLDCEGYVGRQRDFQSEAETDRTSHKSDPMNKDHEVKIEVTQKFHI